MANDGANAGGADSHTDAIKGAATGLEDLKVPRINMKVRDMSQLMMVDQLLPFTDRGSNTMEQTVFEQLFVPDHHAPDARAAQMKLLAERFSRSLLSFLAPLVALLGVAFTTRLTNWFALPLSCLALMSVNLGAEALINAVVPVSVAAALLPIFLLYAAVGGDRAGRDGAVAQQLRPPATGPRMSLQRRGARPIFLNPLGIHTRYMLGAYLRHTLMVAAALMTIALTIDLFPQIALLRDSGIFAVFGIARLAALRLPTCCRLSFPSPRFSAWSGRSAFTESPRTVADLEQRALARCLCLVPALLAGLAMGAALFVVDAILRPAAIHLQIEETLGREGIRLDRSQSGGNHWIALNDGLLRAEIEYGPPCACATPPSTSWTAKVTCMKWTPLPSPARCRMGAGCCRMAATGAPTSPIAAMSCPPVPPARKPSCHFRPAPSRWR